MSVQWPKPSLERSILGWDPLDEFAVQVGEWLVQHGHERDNLEIEAKVGQIVEKHSRSRIQLPVRNETIVEMQPGWSFESDMSPAQHAKINELLNSAVEHSEGKFRYKRQQETDLFYRDPDGGGGGKIRVTKESKSFQTIAAIRKIRIADLNIFCPNMAFDYRISINVEEPINNPPGGEPEFSREKNRLHYTHQKVCVDLTQVHGKADSSKPTNELELEFIDAKELLDEAQASVHAAARQEWTPYYDLVLIFLNSIRILIRNVS